MDAPQHMSDVEAMMWNVDKDPFLSSTFGSVTYLDTMPDLDRLRRRLARMVVHLPRLHQRVTPVLGRLAPPEWSDDPDFDLDHHVRHIALPSPGTDRELLDLVTWMVADPFDRTRPLWEFIVVEGLEGDRAALVQKMHHTITDGEGGIRMSQQFIDVERDAPDIDEVEIPTTPAGPRGDVVHAAADAFGHTFRRTLGAAQRTVVGTADAVIHPTRLPALGLDAVEMARSAVRQVTITDRSHSPLWAQRSLRRRFEKLDVDFDDAYAAAKARGGSLNDLFVTAAATGAGDYHRRLGTPVAELRMAMPISTRTDRSSGGNAFVPTRVLVPTGDLTLDERFAQVHEVLGRTKGERVLGMVNGLAGVVNVLPTSVLVRFVRAQVETVDFTTSNVRAAPFDLFIGGARIEGTYPLGPLGGTAFNLTMMSYAGTLNLGLHIDSGAVDEPELLRDCMADAFAALID